MGAIHSTKTTTDDEPATKDDNNTVKLSTSKMPFKVVVPSATATLRIVCISDTHMIHKELVVPDGDVLIHCGDFTKYKSSKSDIVPFNEWLGTLPHKVKIVIGGNHDNCLPEKNIEKCQKLLSNATYLQDSGITVEGVKIWGSPWQPSRGLFKRANAFSTSVPKIIKRWQMVPDDTDILITHVPPLGILDLSHHGNKVGCPDLRNHCITKIKPKVHLFGHCHDETGAVQYESEDSSILFLNVAQIYARQPLLIEISSAEWRIC